MVRGCFIGAAVGLCLCLGPTAQAVARDGGHLTAHYAFIANDIREPHWAATPNSRDLASLYPQTTDEGEGASVMRCKVSATGALLGCEVVAEQPAGQGFGRATLLLARYFRLKHVQRDGRPIAGRTVVVPIQWKRG